MMSVVLQKLQHFSLLSIRSSSKLAVSIQENIEKKRAKAKLGGGQHRIDAQHKKVCMLIALSFKLCFSFYFIPV